MKFLLTASVITYTLAFLFYYNYTWFLKHQSILSVIFYIISNNISFGAAGMVFQQYELLLMCLRSRFRMMNSLIRYKLITPSCCNNYSIFVQNIFCRRRFLNMGKTIQTIENETSNNIKFINSIARLHNVLCEVIDDMNICYSFQVVYFGSYSHLNSKCHFKWLLF